MKSRILKKQTDDDKQGVHRLTNIVVEEVSLVDRPANQQPFLILKRSKEPTEIVLNDDGELVLAKDKDGTDKRVHEDEFFKLLTEAKSSIADAEKSSDAKKADKLIGKAVDSLQKARSYTTDKGSAEKAGAKISRSRLDQLSRAIDSLLALQKELVAEKSPAKSEKANDGGEVPGFVTAMMERVDKLTNSVGKIHEVVKDQEQRIRKNADTVSNHSDEAVVSNQVDSEAGSVVTVSVEKTYWPEDLALDEDDTPAHRSCFDDDWKRSDWTL